MSTRRAAMLRPIRLVIPALLTLALVGCAETQLAVHAAKKTGKESERLTGSTRKIDAERVRRASLRPYTIKGVRYYPKDDPDYDETGLASWYGEPFHGRATATGEIYDMNQVTAAHKTLPLPSTVEVTNLENGRVMTVRVNDRGPFVRGRIIDMSRRGAQLLGFQKQGVARVRVRVIESERDKFVLRPKKISPAEQKAVKAAPRAKIAVATLPAPSGTEDESSIAKATPKISKPAPVTFGRQVGEVEVRQPAASSRLYVQAASFSSYQNALRLRARLSPMGDVAINHALVNNRDFFRVRLGPYDSVEAADRHLAQVMATGLDDARIIVD